MIRVDMPWMYSMHWPVTVVPRGILTTRPAADMVQEGATAQVYLSLRKTDCALRHSGSARGRWVQRKDSFRRAVGGMDRGAGDVVAVATLCSRFCRAGKE
jgi:hypothetical protein